MNHLLKQEKIDNKWIFVDRIHMTDLGYRYCANIINELIKSLFVMDEFILTITGSSLFHFPLHNAKCICSLFVRGKDKQGNMQVCMMLTDLTGRTIYFFKICKPSALKRNQN